MWYVVVRNLFYFFFFSSRRRHTRCGRDWSQTCALPICLGAEGLDPSILEPVAVTQVDASTEAERSSGMLSWLIPFFIAIWTLTGGQMTAIDATAGERSEERRVGTAAGASGRASPAARSG